MSDIQPTVGASDPSQLATPSPAQRIAAAAALIPSTQTDTRVNPAAPIAPVQTAPDKTEPTRSPPLADAVKAMREARAKQAQEAQRQAAYEAENARLKQELDQIRAHQSFEDDPVGYAQARQWTKEQQLTFGQALLYDLAPDKADPNFRIKMFEDKQKREKATEAKKSEEQRAQQEEAERRETLSQFVQAIEAGVMSFEAGSYPESEDWYGTDVEGYLRAMHSTALQMAQEATKAGTQADLTPPSIAAKLEADTVARVAARDKRRAMRTPTFQGSTQQRANPAPDAELSVDTTSTRDMSGGGAPLPPARSESERLQRAVAAGFKSR